MRTATAMAMIKQDPQEYATFLKVVAHRFKHSTGQLFTTDVKNLNQTYLLHLPFEERQHHTCHTCRRFIENFGGLVTIDNHGCLISALWTGADMGMYKDVALALKRRVERASITGVFQTTAGILGTPKSGDWSHLAVEAKQIYYSSLLSAEQRMAEQLMDFQTVVNALGVFKREHIATALTILQGEAVYRSEKVLGQAEWLYRLSSLDNVNLIWREVAAAPTGFCHPRASMIGTLLEDISAGKSFDAVKKSFEAKMHPLKYLRPQAAPTIGVIRQAESIIGKLEASGSLARRFCRLDEVKALWKPIPVVRKDSRLPVFGHLVPGDQPFTKAATPLTFVKFQQTVLQHAQGVEIFVPNVRIALGPLVTADNAEAPPIFQWDSLEIRNPVSWYVYHGGALPSDFGLVGGAYHNVDAITLRPSMWNGGFEHHGKGVIFIIKSAHETRKSGLCLFPECLKTELHGIRSVIENYSAMGKIEGLNLPHAAGLMCAAGQTWDVMLRVTTAVGVTVYKLDRWD